MFCNFCTIREKNRKEFLEETRKKSPEMFLKKTSGNFWQNFPKDSWRSPWKSFRKKRWSIFQKSLDTFLKNLGINVWCNLLSTFMGNPTGRVSGNIALEELLKKFQKESLQEFLNIPATWFLLKYLSMDKQNSAELKGTKLIFRFFLYYANNCFSFDISV